MLDKLFEACGIFGVYSLTKRDVSKYIYFGLYALQHRGQESAGIVTTNGDEFKSYLGMGLVNVVFSKEEIFQELMGHIGIGHTRYSTTGASVIVNGQPIIGHTTYGTLAIAHNGNLTNIPELKAEL